MLGPQREALFFLLKMESSAGDKTLSLPHIFLSFQVCLFLPLLHVHTPSFSFPNTLELICSKYNIMHPSLPLSESIVDIVKLQEPGKYP